MSGKIYKQYFDGGLKSQELITTFDHLRRFIPDGFILICDQAPIHKSEDTLRYFFEHPEIIVEPLPKYAPELNPEEYCHGNVKAHIANATPHDRPQVRQLLDLGFARLRKRPDLLLGFIRAAGMIV
jgi:transposase